MSAFTSAAPKRPAATPIGDRTSWITSLRLDLPFACLFIALGMAAASYGYSSARVDAPEASILYWCGLAMMMLAPVWRLMQPGLTRRERMGIILALGLALYFVKVMQHPTRFAYHDEHAHWRSALDIVRTGKLYNVNPLLPVTPLYPGLALATASLAKLTGLDLFACSVLLISAARVVMMLALYHLFETATRSDRAAGLACAFYAANPNFLFFDSQFSYETLALPLAIMLTYAMARTQQSTEAGNTPGLTLIAVLTLISNAMTHHFTSYVTIVFLTLWGLMCLLFRKHQYNRPVPLNIAILAILINASWLLYVANFTVTYLAYVFQSAFEGLVSAASAGGSVRKPFELDSAGSGPPIYQRLLGFASVGFTVAGIPFGLWEVLRRHRSRAMLLVMAGGMLLQPVMYVLRLTSSSAGWEISNRSAEFIFLAIAPVVSMAVFSLSFPAWIDAFKRWIVAPALMIVLIGGIIVSTPPWMLLPWPYHAGSDQRSIELLGLSAAQWSKEYLGPDRRIVTDRVNGLLWATHGLQFLASSDGHPILPGLLLSPRFDATSRAIARQARLEYLIADMRFSEQEPLFGYYYVENERAIYGIMNPLPRASLEKYDSVTNVHRVFDNGAIVVYDMRRISFER